MSLIRRLGTDAGYLDLNDIDAGYVIRGATLDATTPGQITFTLVIAGATPAERVQREQAFQAMLNLAAVRARQQGSDWIAFQQGQDAAALVSFDVRRGTMRPAGVMADGRHADWNITLTCLPYARGAAITLTPGMTIANGDPGLLIEDVPGDAPDGALVRLELADASTSGVVNRLWIGRYSGSGLLAATDADAWVDAAALPGATTTADATAVGGDYIERTVTTQADLARVVMPAGALNRGRRDVWARVRASGTAMSAPTGLAASVAAPLPTVRQTASGTAGSPGGTSVSATWANTTLAGSTLVAVVHTNATASDTTGILPLITMSSSWTLVGYEQEIETTPYNQTAVFVIEGASTQSGTVTVSFSSSIVSRQIVLYELTNTPSTGALVASGPQRDGAVYTLGVSERYALVIAGGGHGSSSASGVAVTLGGGYTLTLNHTWAKVGHRFLYSPGTALAQIVTNPTPQTGVMVAFRGDPASATGELDPGSYTARVQALDAFGNAGNASTSVNFTITYAGSIPTLSWTAPSGDVVSYRITIQRGTSYWSTDTGSTDTSFAITSLDGWEAATGLPAVLGATAPSPRLIPRLGTTGQASADLTDLPEIVLPGDDTWRLVRITTGREFPPSAATLDGERADWALELQDRSANGLSATVQVDAIWLVPHDEPVAEVWKHGLDLATRRRWIIETDRTGRGLVVRTEDLTTGAITESLVATGTLTLASGVDAILAFALEQAGGVSAIGTAQVTVSSVTIWPRYVWQAAP